jgi:catechol 2,3-dioxygenase-like lactoylglutathione lyase family enzyme
MALDLDHFIVSARDQRASAELLARLLGVPWSATGVGPFSPVYLNDGLTLDFIDDPAPTLPVEHFCFRVSDAAFDATLRRLEGAGIRYRSTVRGPDDMQVGREYGGRNVYWDVPDGHRWEMLTVSYARAPRDAEGASAGAPIDYLHPRLPAGLRRVVMPVVDASDESLRGYGRLIDDPSRCEVEIVRWPRRGSRPIDADTGDQGGTTEGVFVSEWRGDILYGSNDAVGGHYILGYGEPPEVARDDHDSTPRRVMLWHANYHPDGGQLFFPLESRPFLVPLALPGDDVTPERFVCFRFDGRQGLYIHPDVWHEGVFAVAGTQRFFDKQGAVHARVSVDFAREFSCLIEAPI